MESDELDLLKNFVQSNLADEDTIHLKFDSGRLSTKGNLAPIIQIGLALKKMT